MAVGVEKVIKDMVVRTPVGTPELVCGLAFIGSICILVVNRVAVVGQI